MVIHPALADQRAHPGLFGGAFCTPAGYNHFHEFEQPELLTWTTGRPSRTAPSRVAIVPAPEEPWSFHAAPSGRADVQTRVPRQLRDVQRVLIPDSTTRNVDDVQDMGEARSSLAWISTLASWPVLSAARSATRSIRTFDEIAVKNSNTDEVAQMLSQRRGCDRRIICYPDPTGRAKDISSRFGPRDPAQMRVTATTVSSQRKSAWICVKDSAQRHLVWLICNAEGATSPLCSIRAARCDQVVLLQRDLQGRGRR